MNKDIILCDLDGTLAEISHRLHLVKTDRPNWDEFYDSCDLDSVNMWCREVLSSWLNPLMPWRKVFIVSARRQHLYKKTMRWLSTNQVEFSKLILVRPDGNHEEDQELKRRWLHQSGLKDRILLVIDDRSKVCKMWREEGLTCLQCADWEEYHAKKV
jgi:hypothetical protein